MSNLFCQICDSFNRNSYYEILPDKYLCTKCYNTIHPNNSESIDPKQSQAVKKMSFKAVPISLLMHAQPGNQNGADKYGVYNWLTLDDGSMSMTTYLDALQRHLVLFRAGQDRTSDTNIHNLDSMISGLAVLRDAMLFNKVNDDRVKLSDDQIKTLEAIINQEVSL